MRKKLIATLCLLLTAGVWAEEKGGFKNDAAPPPPHQLDDGYRGMEDGRIMTVEQAKNWHHCGHYSGSRFRWSGNQARQTGEHQRKP